MLYNTDILIQEALSEGFTNAGPLNLKALVFMPEVREMCSADRCNMYGKSWRCPPGCGSIEEAAEEASKYAFGMIVQTTGNMGDEFDFETIDETGKKHKSNFEAYVAKLRKRYDAILPMGAGTCKLCDECAYPDTPCRYPDQAISSMEAYGLWVSKVCELSGIPYYYGKLTLTYTSCYLLGRQS